MTLLLPRQVMRFDVFDLNDMQWTIVKVTLPYIFLKHFRDFDDWLDRVNEFVKHNSLNECFFFRVELYGKVYWYNYEQLGVLAEAVEKRFVQQLYKEVEQQ